MAFVRRRDGFGVSALWLVIIATLCRCTTEANGQCLKTIPTQPPQPTQDFTLTTSSSLAVSLQLACNASLGIQYFLSYAREKSPLASGGTPSTSEPVSGDSAEIKNLIAYASYEVTLLWFLSDGSRLESNVTVMRTNASDLDAPEDPPQDLSIVAIQSNSLRFQFSPPLQPNSRIVKYNCLLQSSGGVTTTTFPIPKANGIGECSFTKLQQNTMYTLMVTAVNENSFNNSASPPATEIVSTLAQDTSRPRLLYLENGHLFAATDLTKSALVNLDSSGGAITGYDYFLNFREFNGDILHVVYFATTDSQSPPRTTIYGQFIIEQATSADGPPSIKVLGGRSEILSNLTNFTAVRIDWLNRRVYVSHANGTVPQISYRGFLPPPNAPGSTPLITGQELTEVPVDFAVDPINGYIYWATAQGIFRADLEGNGVQPVVVSALVTRISLELVDDRLYFLNNQTLFLSNLDGGSQTAAIAASRGLSGHRWRDFTVYDSFRALIDTTGNGVELMPGESPAVQSGFQNASALHFFSLGRQPIPVSQRPVRDFQVLTTTLNAELSWSVPSLQGISAGSYQQWAYRIDYALVSTMADSIDNAAVIKCKTTLATQLALNGLQPDSLYSFRIRPFNPRTFLTALQAASATPNLDAACNVTGLTSKLSQQSVTDIVKTLPAATHPPELLLATGTGVVSTTLDGQSFATQVNRSAVAVEYERLRSSLIWAEQTSGGKVSVFQTNISLSVTKKVQTDISLSGSSFSMAVDWIGQRLFWSPGLRIYKSNLLNASAAEQLPGADHRVTDMTLDVLNGYAYWVYQATIHVARLNGDFRAEDPNIITVLAPVRPVNLPNTFVALDYADDGYLYFAVMGLSDITIQRSRPNPTTGQLLGDETVSISSGNVKRLSVFASKVFWTDGSAVRAVDSSRTITGGIDIPATRVALLTMRNTTDLSVADKAAPAVPSGCSSLPGDADPGTLSNLQPQIMSRSISFTWDNSRTKPNCSTVYYVLQYRLTNFSTGGTSSLMYWTGISSAVGIFSLEPSTNFTLLKLQAYTPWFSSNVLSGDFITSQEAPTASPSHLRTFYQCEASNAVCNVELRWNTVPRAHQNGPLSSHIVTVQKQPSGKINTITVAGNADRFSTILEPGQYRFTVMAKNEGGSGPSATLAQNFTAGEAVITPIILTQTTSQEEVVAFDLDTSQQTVLVDNDDLGGDVLQFLEVAASTNEVFFVTAIVGRLWDIRYKSPGAPACSIAAKGSAPGVTREIHGLAFDYIGRTLYFSEENGATHTLHSIILPQGSICNSSIVDILLTGTSTFSSLSFARRTGLLYYVSNFRLDSCSHTGCPQVRKRRATRQGSHLYVESFQTTAAIVDPVTGDLIIASDGGPGVRRIWHCPSKANCTSHVQTTGIVDSLHVDTTFVYWTITGNSTTIFYWPRNGNDQSPIETTSRQPDAPVVTYSPALQPPPSAECRLPSDSGTTRNAPSATSKTSTSLTVQLPQLKLSDNCNETKTFAVVTVTVETKGPSGAQVSQDKTTNRTVTISGLTPFTEYNVRVVHLSNFWGNQTITGSTLSVVTDEDVASQPKNVTATSVAPNVINVTWLPPATPNGQIVSYQLSATTVSLNTVSGTAGPAINSAILTGLEPATSYRVEVWAVNGNGPGTRAQVTTETLRLPPDPKMQDSGNAGSLIVACMTSLQPPEYNCLSIEFICRKRLNCLLKTCTLVRNATVLSQSPNETLFEVTGVEENSVFSLRRTLGYGASSEYVYTDMVTSNYTTAETVPSMPLTFTLAKVTSAITNFTWSRPSCLGSGNPLMYILRYTTVSGNTKDVAVTATPEPSGRLAATVPFNATYLNVTIIAKTDKGESPPGAVVILVSSEPRMVTATSITPGAFSVAWLPPISVSSSINSYRLSAKASGSPAVDMTASGGDRGTVITGLQPATNYTVQVWAVSRMSEGLRAQVVAATMNSPSPPTQVVDTSRPDSLSVTCVADSLPENVTCVSVEFECKELLNCISSSCSAIHSAANAKGRNSKSTNMTIFQANGVAENALFSVRRSLRFGAYVYNETVATQYRSAETVPTAPRNFGIVGQPTTTLNLVWNRPQCYGSGNPVQYTLRFSRKDGNTEDVPIDLQGSTAPDGTLTTTVVYKSTYENVTIVASTSLGESAEGAWLVIGDPVAHSSSSNSTLVIVIAAVGGCLLLLFIIIVLYLRRKSKQRRFEPRKSGVVSNQYGLTLQNLEDDDELLRLRNRLPTGMEINNQFYHAAEKPDETLPIFPRERLTLTDFLGQGAFGEVYKGIARQLSPKDGPDDETVVAVKTLHKNAEEKDKKEFLAEAKLMCQFDHPHILKVLGVCISVELSPCFIILEIMEQGDLLKFVRKQRPETNELMTYLDVYTIASDIAQGCAYLEGLHFVHRDLAARNCLVGGTKSNLIVKIGDFGLARDIYKNDYYRKEGAGLLPVRWMAPEALLDGVFTTQSDVWSFGILLWEITTLGNQPYPARTNQEVLKFVCQEFGRLEPPQICPENLAQLMLRCWSKGPMDRPRFTDLADELVILHEEAKRNKTLGFYGVLSGAANNSGAAIAANGGELVAAGFDDPTSSPEFHRSARGSVKRSSSRRKRPDGIPLLEMNPALRRSKRGERPNVKQENEYVESTPASQRNSMVLRTQLQDSPSSHEKSKSQGTRQSGKKSDTGMLTIFTNPQADTTPSIPDGYHNTFISGQEAREANGQAPPRASPRREKRSESSSANQNVPEGYHNMHISGRQARDENGPVAVVPEGYDNHHISGRKVNTAQQGVRPVPAARHTSVAATHSEQPLANYDNMNISNHPVARDRLATAPQSSSASKTVSSNENVHISNTPSKRRATTGKTPPQRPTRSSATVLSSEHSYQNVEYNSKAPAAALSEQERGKMLSAGSTLLQNRGAMASDSFSDATARLEDEGVLI